jgi:hypothetical protein
VAHWLKDRGFDAYAVRGGVEALRGESVAAAFAEGARDLRTTAGRRGGPLGALRHRHFRRYSAGVLFSLIGNWIEGAAFGYVVLLLGGSAATLALIGFLTSLPNLVLACRRARSPIATTRASSSWCSRASTSASPRRWPRCG